MNKYSDMLTYFNDPQHLFMVNHNMSLYLFSYLGIFSTIESHFIFINKAI